MLVPLEREICRVAADLLRQGEPEFHGYRLAKRLREVANQQLLIAHGTLYRALGRLEDMGMVTSRWEDPDEPERENRPRRRLYRLTAVGKVAAREAPAKRSPRRRLAPA